MKSRMPRMLGAFPDAVVIVDAQGMILQANTQAMALFGAGKGQLNGTPIQALFPAQPSFPVYRQLAMASCTAFEIIRWATGGPI